MPRLSVTPRPLISRRVEQVGGVLVKEVEYRYQVGALCGGRHQELRAA
jgi:hypothetical protein